MTTEIEETLFSSKTLIDFEGRIWNIERVIIDHKQSTKTVYGGRCEISSGKYFETGKLILADGQKMLSSRTYYWKSVGQGIDSYFDDGSFFHSINLTCSRSIAHHFCADDEYEVRYDFSKWPLWVAKWCVRGPRKDYEMYSYYSEILI